ncbi:hypothetical protein ACLB1Q_12260 [Escherichia coli]
MGKRTLTLGYAIVIIDILAGTVGTVQHRAYLGVRFFRSLKTCCCCLNYSRRSSACRIGGYLMWMMVISTSLSCRCCDRAAPTCWVWSSSAKLPVSRLAGCSGSSASAGWGYLAYHCAVAFLRAVQTGNHTQ